MILFDRHVYPSSGWNSLAIIKRLLDQEGKKRIMWSQIKGSWVKPTKRLSSAARQAACLWSWALSDRYLVSALFVKRKLMPKTSLALSRLFCRSPALKMCYWPMVECVHWDRHEFKMPIEENNQPPQTCLWFRKKGAVAGSSLWSLQEIVNATCIVFFFLSSFPSLCWSPSIIKSHSLCVIHCEGPCSEGNSGTG